MTLAEMRALLRTKIGNPTVTDVTDATLDRLLNSSHRDIATRYRFQKARCISSFSTISGTKRYSLPTDLGTLYSVWDETNKHRINPVGMRKLEDDTADDIEGFPTTYVRARGWIELFPVPNGIYTISILYKTNIATLVADADVPIIPEPWHDGIVAYARWMYYDEVGDLSKAQYCYASWKLWLSDKPSEFDEEVARQDNSIEVTTLKERSRNKAFHTRWATDSWRRGDE